MKTRTLLSAILVMCVQTIAAQSFTSVLKSGHWVKIAVNADGVYKIPYTKLSEWGFDNPKNIRVFGNDFGLLPFMNSAERPQDLIENKVLYGDDAVYFFAKSKDIWNYNEEEGLFLPKTHLYDTRAYYFLSDVTTNYNNSITKPTSAPTPQGVVTQGDFYAIHDNNDVNLQMSGRNWYGENFYYATQQDLKIELPAPAISADAKAKVSVIARSAVDNSFDVSFNGGAAKSLVTKSVSGLSIYADTKMQIIDFKSVNGNVQNIEITFNKSTPSAEGYLDYIIINARGNLNYNGKQLIFRDIQSHTLYNAVEFQVSGVDNGCLIWDVTNSTAPEEADYTLNNGVAKFTAKTETLGEYVVFSKSNAYTPEFVENVGNQNLHAQNTPEMLIVTPLEFKTWADKIAAIHSGEMSVMVTPINQIYNEFSCGAKDVSAIRDYIRYLYKNAKGNTLRYVLLFGDGTVDNITVSQGNTNYIPTYQCPQSLDEDDIISFISDDYFALLDDDEGEYTGLPDIAVGRIPVKTTAEAETAAKKIELYTKNFFNSWEKNIAFIADDENLNIHASQADQIAVFTETEYPNYDITKIYIDAYPRQQTIGGNLYPQAREDILKQFNLGAKIINFTGHGGIDYLTDERILTNADIDNLKNIDNLPVFITSSCDVGRFDHYERSTDIGKDSPAERALHNTKGGAIAMIAAARHAYAEPNFNLNKNIFNYILRTKNASRIMRLGDVVMLAKRETDDINMRCFMLLGDPALILHSPEYFVKILKINGIDATTYPDTIKSLSACKLECAVTQSDGSVVNSFNGTAHIVFYDKQSNRKTLNNSGSGVFEFQDYDKKIFDGYSTVKNGVFKAEFIVPKDIDYKVDKAKVSLFARSNNKSASGVNKDLLAGSANNNAALDNLGPQIQLYINSKEFTDGGNVGEAPLVIAELSDTSGINITSEGNGHDISLTIDGGQPVSLNSFYKSDTDNFRRGTVKYQVDGLAEGRHTIKLKAYDSYNNLSQAEISFTVVKADGFKITRLLNYPNPFTDHTDFYFQQNAPSDVFEYEITVFSISGKQVKTLTGTLSYSGNLSQPIPWDGLDDFGSKIARGTYIYRLRIRDFHGRKATSYEKLLYLK